MACSSGIFPLASVNCTKACSRQALPAADRVRQLFAGALGGILIPMALERVRADPAVASGTFVTTVTDVVGFFSFLGIATLWFGLR